MMIGKKYWKALYDRTMHLAYQKAFCEIENALLNDDSTILDCGAYQGNWFNRLQKNASLSRDNYFGIEWNHDAVEVARKSDLQVRQGDLNKPLPFSDNTFSVCYGLSVAEHLIMPCYWMRECYRVLKEDGLFVILTPNISNY